jgi:hypothetical protein
MTTKSQSRLFFQLLPALMAGSLLLTACAPAAVKSNPVAVSAPTAASQPASTASPAQTVLPAPAGSPSVSIDTSGMASDIQTETVAAMTDTNNAPYWEILPAYTRVTLQGYPVSSSLLQPQIFVFPVQDLVKINEGAAGIVASLQTLLQSPAEVKDMPFLPLFNAAQMMHAQVQYKDFKNGRGVRYLTQFSQAILPINNHDLIYTFQGLTSDGRYYVAAVLPVNQPSLPADEKVDANLPPEFTSDFPAYLANMVKLLNSQAPNTFTPDLSLLDAMLSSLEIK